MGVELQFDPRTLFSASRNPIARTFAGRAIVDAAWAWCSDKSSVGCRARSMASQSLHLPSAHDILDFLPALRTPRLATSDRVGQPRERKDEYDRETHQLIPEISRDQLNHSDDRKHEIKQEVSSPGLVSRVQIRTYDESGEETCNEVRDADPYHGRFQGAPVQETRERPFESKFRGTHTFSLRATATAAEHVTARSHESHVRSACYQRCGCRRDVRKTRRISTTSPRTRYGTR